MVEREGADLADLAIAVPDLLPLGHGVRIIAVVVGIVLGGMRFADVVQSPVFAVDVEHRVFIILRGQLGEGADRQLVHEVITHQGGIGALLCGAKEDRGEVCHAVAEEIVVQLAVEAGKELQLEGLFGLRELGGRPVQLDAAGHGEALPVLKELDRADALDVLAGVAVESGGAGDVGRIAHQAHDRQGMPFVDDESQLEDLARQLALLHLDGAHNAGLGQMQGLGVMCRAGGRRRSIERIIDFAGCGQLDGHAVYALEHAVTAEQHGLFGNQTAAAGVRCAGRGTREVKESVLTVHAAKSAVIGNIMQGDEVRERAVGAAEIKLIALGAQAEGREIASAEGFIAGAVDDSDLAGSERALRQLIDRAVAALVG